MKNDARHAVPVIPWWAGGLGIALVLILAVALVQPIGVSTQYVALEGGLAFGAVLQLSGASSHTMITNALRLKDLTIMKLILTAIGVGLIGVHLLDALGMANMKVKDLYLPGMVVAGLIFGVGFAVTGYCPGTALAAAAEEKPDAWATVLGGLLGALVFAFMFPDLETYLLSLGQ